jgi:hypothetical protein
MATIKIAKVEPVNMKLEVAALGVSDDDGVKDQAWWGSE